MFQNIAFILNNFATFCSILSYKSSMYHAKEFSILSDYTL